MFRHPQYYKNLRKLARLRNRDQAISSDTATAASERAPGTGHKQQASSAKLRYTPTGILLGVDLGDKPQASSKPKPEPSSGSGSLKRQATSIKPRVTSVKL